MQRLSRSAHVPLGAVFFLFLGLTIVPVSLKAAGVQVGFSPRLSAAVDVWRQIAGLFGSNYQPGTESETPALNNSTSEPSRPVDDSGCPRPEFACVRELEELSQTSPDVWEVPAPRSARGVCPKSAARNFQAALRVEPVAVAAIKASFERHAQVLEALGAVKMETVSREEVLKRIEKHVLQQGFEPRRIIQNLPIPSSLRVLVRAKLPAPASATKTAECKVLSALTDARRRERERASRTGTPTTTPDNCEL